MWQNGIMVIDFDWVDGIFDWGEWTVNKYYYRFIKIAERGIVHDSRTLKPNRASQLRTLIVHKLNITIFSGASSVSFKIMTKL